VAGIEGFKEMAGRRSRLRSNTKPANRRSSEVVGSHCYALQFYYRVSLAKSPNDAVMVMVVVVVVGR
jgi:hypothetical protein